jgi:hypothetical protein
MPDPPSYGTPVLWANKVALSYQRPCGFLSLLPLKQLMLRRLYCSSVNQAPIMNIWRWREERVPVWAMRADIPCSNSRFQAAASRSENRWTKALSQLAVMNRCSVARVIPTYSNRRFVFRFIDLGWHKPDAGNCDDGKLKSFAAMYRHYWLRCICGRSRMIRTPKRGSE